MVVMLENIVKQVLAQIVLKVIIALKHLQKLILPVMKKLLKKGDVFLQRERKLRLNVLIWLVKLISIVP
jgi:hypothetical protein